MSNPPTVHDKRVMENEEYLDVIVKSVNPHNSPKESLKKIFPSANVLIVKGDTTVPEKSVWQCDKNGCDFQYPIVSLFVVSSVTNLHKGVVERLRCMPVLTCPLCMQQHVSLYEEEE